MGPYGAGLLGFGLRARVRCLGLGHGLGRGVLGLGHGLGQGVRLFVFVQFFHVP